MTHRTFLYFTLAFFFVVICSAFRPVNADEGYYMLSASKILQMQIPYIDFRFHHMPLMIYVYSLVSDFGYWSLVFGRLLSILFTFITAALIYKFLSRQISNTIVPRLFLVLYFCNAFFIDWAITVKIYSVSSMIFTLAVLTFFRVVEKEEVQENLFISALLFSLLLMTRIVFIANLLVFIAFGLLALNRVRSERKLKPILLMGGGMLLPILIFFLYFKNNLGVVYSNVIEEPSMIKSYLQLSYLTAIFKLLLYFLLPQNLLLLAIVLLSGFKCSLFEKFLAFNLIAYFVIHLPTQMLPEYLSNITPIFLMLVMLRYEKFEANIKKMLKYKPNLRFAFIFLYLTFLPFGIAHIKHIIQNRPLMPNPLQLYGISSRINSLEGKTILSSWEGYPVFSNKISVFKERYLPVYDEVVGDTARINKFKLTSPDDSKKLIAAKIPDVIVYDSEEPRMLEGLSDMINNEYKKVYDFKYLTVYKK
jgi:hypothetical protein